MTVLAWYLVKRGLSSVRYCTVAYTIVTFYKVPEQHGHVYLVGLYISILNCTLMYYIELNFDLLFLLSTVLYITVQYYF